MKLQLLKQLKRDEGLELFPYNCPAGYWTIGVGRNLETRGLSHDEQCLFFGKPMNKQDAIACLHTRGVTKEEAKAMLERDVLGTFDALIKRIDYLKHDDVRYSVLVNMAFQIGVRGLMKFKKTIEFFNNKNYEATAAEMLNSKWAKQTPERAERLSKQMLTGEWV